VSAEIAVKGVSEVRVMPDHASVQVVVDGEGSSQEAAYEAAARLARAVDDVLEARASVLGRVVTAALVVQPKSRWRKGESVRTGWRAARSTLVEITATDQVGSVLGELAQAGGAIRGPWWELAPANPAHDAVRAAAAEDARRRADAYAAGLGLVVGAVAWVAEPGLRIGARGGGWGDELSAMSAAGAAGSMHEEEPSIAVAPGEVTLTAAVEIGFEFAASSAPPEPG
jgi:uncharacterized protein YggE